MNSNPLEVEYTEIASKNAWQLVYQRIGRECQSYPYTCIEAKKTCNKSLNRYRDVSPYDHSRIILKRGTNDYINANLVKMDRANRRYILTQGPLKFTVSHFWLMVWEQDSRAILMLNKIIEKQEIKCHWYWPQGNGDKMQLNDVDLVIEQLTEEDFSYYSTRLFKITDLESGNTREVIQFHYTTWPDFGVPSSPVAFLEFLQKVRSSGALESNVGPAVVHCSAGIGRSGTFCLVDSCLVIIEKDGVASLNIQKILLEMRKDRMGLIQTPDQLRFSYQAIIEGSRRLGPDWVNDNNDEDPDVAVEEVVYAEVAEEEAPPPPPPPRGESLAGAPARPLPAIPASTSAGNLSSVASTSRGPDAREDDSQSDAGPSGSSTRDPNSPSNFFADDEDDTPVKNIGSVECSDTLRKRRARELANRVASMKRRARQADRWNNLKRAKSGKKPKTEEKESRVKSEENPKTEQCDEEDSRVNSEESPNTEQSEEEESRLKSEEIPKTDQCEEKEAR